MGKEIGIDFGTTTTEVSYIDAKGLSRSLKLEKNSDVIPTVLFFESEDVYCIGTIAKKKAGLNPEACVRNFKLYFTDPTKRYEIKAENGDEFKIKPIKAAQLFLNRLIQNIQPKLIDKFGEADGTIDRAVITVPAQFDPEEKAAVKRAISRAAELAGFSEIKVAAEPTAAAVAYQDDNCEEGDNILVYDFGGGTFDVSVIQKKDGVYTEIATDGDKRLGGNLLTEKLAQRLWNQCLKIVKRDYPFDEDEVECYCEEDYGLSVQRFKLNRMAVFEAAESMKIDFLEEDETDDFIQFYRDNEEEAQLVEVNMEIEEFNDCIREDIQRTVQLTSRVLQETMERDDVNRIDQVVLAGGSSQIRLIRDLLEQDNNLSNLVGGGGDSSTLISRGAALLASTELHVEEKTRFEIGTRASEGKHLDVFIPIIHVGEKLPCSGKQCFYPRNKGQSEVTVEYYEKDVKNYPHAKTIDDEGINLVNELTISGIPEQEGLSVMVTFEIQKDGTPTITGEILDKEGRTVKADQLSISRRENLY